MRQVCVVTVFSLVAAVAVGCNETQPPAGSQTVSTAAPAPATGAAEYLLASEPEGAADVIKVRESAGNDDQVVIVGRIGGDVNPWIEGRAAFSIVDPSLKACSDIPGDACPYPWDYCCATDQLPTAMAFVEVVDAEGKLVETDARELLDLKELQTVVVQGTARRDDAGNLTVLATGLYVRK